MNKIMPKLMLAVVLIGALWVLSGCSTTPSNPKATGEITFMEFDEEGINCYATGGSDACVVKPAAHWIKVKGYSRAIIMETDEEILTWHLKKDKFDAGEKVYWP